MSETPTCPTPHKKRYATREAADNAVHRSQIAIEDPLHPYICVCTWWHLSKQPADEIPADATADPIDVRRLQLQSDTAFRETVALEARGKAPLEDRLALRHPGNFLRWHSTLKELRSDLNQQLRYRAGATSLADYDWRKRAEGYRDALTRRIQECRDAQARHQQTLKHEKAAKQVSHLAHEQRAAANAARREARAQELDSQLDQYGVPDHSDKELRRQAGERAITRLIDAHGTEFSRYLAEECAVLGAQIPKRVRKYLADDLAQTA